ncbi:hypothetical protein OROHE_016508 [Orobanche hederae]
MNHALHLLLLLLLLILHRLTLTSADANPPLMSHSIACSDKLVTFSACLPFVAVSPNNLTNSPPPQCCDILSAAFGDDSAICLCYLVLRPGILGFPLNSTNLLSLTSVCPLKDQTSRANFSLKALCSRPAALPPLQGITGPRKPTLPNFGNFGAENSHPPPPLMGSAQESSGSSSTEEPADESSSQPTLPTIPTTISSGTRRMYILSWTWLSSPVYIFSFINLQP